MSSEIHKYIETSLEKKNILNADVINFPQENKKKVSNDLDVNKFGYWKLYDKSYENEDGDQLKAVVGICFMFSVLILLGLYSSLV
tara:strand:+ start:933 stop:1187 length:255 start_codon:yes stop_codon:yes gene_type:complete